MPGTPEIEDLLWKRNVGDMLIVMLLGGIQLLFQLSLLDNLKFQTLPQPPTL